MLTMTTDDLRETAARLPELLTDYQLRIVALARGGHTVVQTAGALRSSARAVEYHRTQIRAALGGVDWGTVEALHRAAGLDDEPRLPF